MATPGSLEDLRCVRETCEAGAFSFGKGERSFRQVICKQTNPDYKRAEQRRWERTA